MIFTPDKTMWFDIAHRTGLDEEESEKSWNHFGANGWKRGNQIKISDWDQVPFLLNTWKWNQPQFERKEKSKSQKLPNFFGKQCYKCHMPARHKTQGPHGDSHYCIEHIPPKAMDRYRGQGYTRDDGSEL